ncbi:hypothetical protein SAMN02745121_05076 [Nannocystis exedens]|uniref:Uncharacterized protein n=1 Tax=Nannocystis exedens TaxID=54 RepID=A0A1I2CDQ2_9BACT|nr:hypothetical protein [Nannocystis exedens]PCC68357.1 hypothetical protein NAEX_01367 [Nannocystis exedens]SFE66322.1 hypothetical protein SAMN02745121_05076 [Nannocystis exedens]
MVSSSRGRSSLSDPTTRFPVSSGRRVLVGTAAAFSLAGLVVELLRHLAGAQGPMISLWSLSYEGNMPSWYASVLPLLCAGLLTWVAAGEVIDRFYWRLLALGFLVISIDEAVGFHEQLSGRYDVGGVLYFDWVIPAGILVAVLGVAFIGFLRRLSPETARRFVVAGALYVTGAVLCELPLGWWTERYGDDSFGYALIDWCEETLEFVGLTVFAAALLARLEGRQLAVTPRGAAPTR